VAAPDTSREEPSCCFDTQLDDWELFLALHRLHPRWDGLITNDDSLSPDAIRAVLVRRATT
jgi:hypothetical protein